MSDSVDFGGGTVWAFDLGTGSIGEAVRKGIEVLHLESLLLPQDFAETRTAATRRRQWRTRQAHLAREKWLREVCMQAGIPVLNGRNRDPENGNWSPGQPGNPRLEREFPPKGDQTCYTSCLLRIKLLRKDRLEGWQIYKALHSAIQKRGYDPEIAWASKETRKSGLTPEQQEQLLAKKDKNYQVTITKWSHFKESIADPEYHYPCYYDAWKMRLWNPALPRQLNERIYCNAESTRNIRFDRKDVEREIRELVNNAAAQYPRLAGKAEYVLYGPAEIPYASYFPEQRRKHGLREGGAGDWQGVLGQKVPRFDNRIVEDCGLLPGRKACKLNPRFDSVSGTAYPDSILPCEVTFLMKLKNTVVGAGSTQRKLTAREIQVILESVRAKANKVPHDAAKWAEQFVKQYSLTKSGWKRAPIGNLNLQPMPGHEEVKPPKFSGRSRFSRPALRLLRELILSGLKPSEFKKQILDPSSGLQDKAGIDVLATEPADVINGVKRFHKRARPWILESELSFLDTMINAKNGDTWEGMFIPDHRHDLLVTRHQKQDGSMDRQAAIVELIGSVKDPVVRYRLNLFHNRLKALEAKFGAPDSIALEFVREDFMGDKAKANLSKFQKDREKAKDRARKAVLATGSSNRSDLLKYELAEAQNFICLYCGQSVNPQDFSGTEIEHIVPRAKGGPDAMINYVLAHNHCNDEKADRTPFQWKHGTSDWEAYKNRVNACAITLKAKKVRLLVQEDAPEIVERYTSLAETAWVAKLAQTVSGLHFGWKNGVDPSGQKRVVVISGGLTGRIRRRYGLNSILNPEATSETDAEKNRKDKRHHALDALVVSFLPHWMRDKSKHRFFRFPEGIDKPYFDQKIRTVYPRNIATEKSQFEETIYGLRKINGQQYIVAREELEGLAITKDRTGKESLKKPTKSDFEKIVDRAIQKDLIAFWQDNPSADIYQWKDWCSKYRSSPKGPVSKKILTKRSMPDATAEYCNITKGENTSIRPQLKKGKRHKGYFIYQIPSPSKKDPDASRVKVRPVYVYETKKNVLLEIKSISQTQVTGFFYAGCTVKVTEPFSLNKTTNWPAGLYVLNSVWTNGQVSLTHPELGSHRGISLKSLLDAGLHRIDLQ